MFAAQSTDPTPVFWFRFACRDRRLPDWIGFFAFGALSVWAILNGWLPVARQSLLAAVLILPSWLTSCVMAIGFLFRRPLVRADGKFTAKAAAYFVTFSMPVFFAVMRGHLHLTAAGAQYILPIMMIVAAHAFALWGAWTIRHAISVEPQARILVTRGPYRYARHPLYAAYLVDTMATALLFSDLKLWAVIVIWFVALLYRIRCEERILTACFPEYAAFRHSVWMFSPRLF